MIVNYRNINLLEIINYIQKNKSYSIIIKYWRMLYFIFRWNNYFLFPMKYKLTKKRYKTQLNLLYFFWKYLKNYFIKNNLYELNFYIENFIEKRIYKDDRSINWNELKKEKKIENYIFFNIYFDSILELNENYKLFYNLYYLKYLNKCY